jgi:hypothetical protein
MFYDFLFYSLVEVAGYLPERWELNIRWGLLVWLPSCLDVA